MRTDRPRHTVEETCTHFGALGVALAVTLLIENYASLAPIIVCCSVLLFWMGWRFSGH